MAKKKKTARPKKTTQPLPGWFTHVPLLGVLLFLLSVLLYANTFKHGYAQDDAIVIYENEFTTKGLAGIGDIFRYDTFRGFFKDEGKATLVTGGRYRPLTLVTFAVEWAFFGKKPAVGHIFNALYYGLTVLLLFLLLLEWFRDDRRYGFAFFVALAASWLFMTHPVHTEAVANIKGRDEIFSLMFSLGALLLSFRALHRGAVLGHLAAGLLFFLALLSKENALALIFAAPIAFWCFSKEKIGGVMRCSLPYWAAAVLMLIIRFSIIPESGEPSMELMNNPFLKLENGRWVALGFGEWSATVMYTLGKYLQLLIFPHPLVHDYYPRHIAVMQWTDWRVLLSLLAYLGMFAYAVLRLPKKDPISFGIFFYLLTLFPVSNILVTVGTNMSERFLFMPSVGFCLVTAVLGYRLAERWKKGKLRSFADLRGMLLLFALVGLLFAVKTVTRNPVWKDNFTLFTSDVARAPNSAKLRNSAGGELIREAILPENENRREEMLRRAVGHLQKAVEIHPTYKNAYLLLGNAHNYLQEFEKAVDFYQKALQLDPAYQEAQNNLFLTLRQAGRYYGEEKSDLQRSLQYLQRAYDMRPDDYETLRLLGIAYGISGDNANAIRYFTRAAEIEPDNAQAWWNLGNAYRYAGNLEKQAEMHARARQLDPQIGQQQN